MNFISLVTHSFQSLRQSLDLLADRGSSCRLCGKPDLGVSQIASGSSAPVAAVKGLCAVCSARIPWIKVIRCTVCGRPVDCGDCLRRTHTGFVCNRSAVRYDQAMKAMFALYKYRGHQALERTLAEMMMPAYRMQTAEAAAAFGVLPTACRPIPERRLARISRQVWDAVTFVPISEQRAEERGFNQAERLARLIAARCGLPLIPLLKRTRHSDKQSFKTRAERIRDMRSLFAADAEGFNLLRRRSSSTKSSDSLSGQNASARILLIDDIYTTGSTVNACADALQGNNSFPTTVYVLTWARS